MMWLCAGALALALAGQAAAPDTATAPAVLHGDRAAAQAVVDADLAFAARAAKAGTAQAFREFMDSPDALKFGSGHDPARGPEAIYQALGGAGPSNNRLTWAPVEAYGSPGMGVTWGRWTLTPGDPARKVRTGRYVTVWRKDAAGRWKGLIDIGEAD